MAVVRLTERCDTLLTAHYDQSHQLFRYTTFLATMAQATDEATMQRAIAALVLPPGSYSIKRRAAHSLSLNAFVGVTGGLEWSDGKPGGHFGPTAPIGLAWNRGLSGGRSLSGFLSLIDLGAMANARFWGDLTTTRALPHATLTQVFSPGVYGVYGFPKLPFSAFLGLTHNFDTRPTAPTTAYNATRIHVRLAVDIPLLHFSASPDTQTK